MKNKRYSDYAKRYKYSVHAYSKTGKVFIKHFENRASADNYAIKRIKSGYKVKVTYK